MLATRVTAAAGVLAVLAHATVARADVPALLPVLAETCVEWQRIGEGRERNSSSVRKEEVLCCDQTACAAALPASSCRELLETPALQLMLAIHNHTQTRS